MISWLLACAGSKEPTPSAPPPPHATGPDILLVTIDTLRADRVGAYGDSRAHTPVLDALAARGVLYREAMAAAPTTLPAHASLLTGRVPRGHGARDNAGFHLDPAVDTLAAALGRAGYATGAFVSATILDPSTGIDRGFATYSAPVSDGAGSGGAEERASADTVRLAEAWWDAATAPRFAWVHLYDPHRPYAAETSGGDPYRAEVAAADAQLGVLLSHVGAGAWVVVSGDHGESLWEHGERDHGLLVSRAALRVPLIVAPPQAPAAGAAVADRPPPKLDIRRPSDLDRTLDLAPVPDAPRAARVVELPVSGLDVAPTLATIAGIPFPGADGEPLPGLPGSPPAEVASSVPRTLYAETWYPALAFGWAPRCAVLQGSRRWTGRSTGTTVDWTSDPGEASPGPDDPALAGLAARFGCSDDPPAATVADRRLQALGYVEGAGELPEGDMDAVTTLLRAEAEAVPEQAEAEYRALLARNPRLWRAWSGLAVALAAKGDPEGALAALTTPGMPESVGLLQERAALLLNLDRLDDALATSERMKTLAPTDPAGWRLAAAVYTRKHDANAAERAAREGLEKRPQDPALLYALGVVLSSRKADREAFDAFSRARDAGSTAKDLDLQLGLLHERAGRYDDAVAAYAAYRATAPDDFRAWAAPAWLLGRLDRCAEALPLAEGALKLRPTDAGMAKVRSACKR